MSGAVTPIFATPTKRLPVWQIWNMSFGFLGVQYAFGLQQAYMSPIYRYLNVDEGSLPLLWLAGPMTGLLIQPIIGAMSDRTWHPRWGRRRPYFLLGAVFTSLALILMPMSTSLWMAAGLMWLLDGAANVTMEPFRAFIADKLPEEQRSTGFSVQSFFVGLGQVLATTMAFILPLLGFVISEDSTAKQQIPDYVKFPFLIGAVVLMGSVLWTVFTTKEEPPQNPEALKKKTSLLDSFKEVLVAIKEMPAAMRQLWWVKFFTWFGLPLMWQYLSLSIARHCYGAATKDAPGFANGIKMGSLGLTMFNVGCILISFLLPLIAKKLTNRGTHAFCLAIGGLGFLGMQFTSDVYTTLGLMVLVGIAWGSIMAMPYVMLANSVAPERMGVYMGIFNMFIVIPQIISMFTVPLIYNNLLGGDPRNALALAGVSLLAAGLACFGVKEKLT